MALLDKENKDKRSTIISIVAISLTIFAFLWRFVFTGVETEYISPAKIMVAPKIDFSYLESEEFLYFERYRPIEPLNEDLMGRENPFLPY
jgi:hypothetical protein